MRPYKIKYLLSLFVLLISFNGSLLSQVLVERSTEKIIVSGKQYYLHTVKKHETAYSIAKAYGIKVDELVKENPTASEGIREGQTLHIPFAAQGNEIKTVTDNKTAPEIKAPAETKTLQDNRPVQEIKRDENRFIYHRLSSGETIFALAKKYGVSEDDILQSNPGTDISKLPVDAEIVIPKRQFNTVQKNLESTEKDFINYKVTKGESITSIANKFGITVKELRRENKGVIFPRVDDYLRIPVPKKAVESIVNETKNDTLVAVSEVHSEKVNRPAALTQVANLSGKFNVALLLPLWFEENAQRTELDSSQIIKGKRVKRVTQRPDEWIFPESMTFLELYQGALIAADSLRSLGLDVNISVFDIKVDTVATVDLIRSGKLDNMDLIIGPVYSKNLGLIADFASSREIPVISPVPPRSNSILQGRPYLFMAFPSLQVAQQAIAKRVGGNFSDNFVLMHSDTAGVDPSIEEFRAMIFKEIGAKGSIDDIKFKEFIFYNRSAVGNDSINRLEHALNEKSDNIILIASEEIPVLSEAIMDLHTLSRKYSLKLCGYPAMRDIDNLEPKYYFDLGIELFSPYWIDYNREDVKKFLTVYRNKFLTEPSEGSFAWQGYDITRFFLSGLAIHGKSFLKDPWMHNPDLLESEYDYQRPAEGSGFENRKLFLIKYTGDMEVKKIDESSVNKY